MLFLDRGSPHTAAASQTLADELNIELRWLPTACPELNPVESLWRWLKGRILCNHQPVNFEDTTHTAINAIKSLTLQKTRKLTGTLSKDFWLRTLRPKARKDQTHLELRSRSLKMPRNTMSNMFSCCSFTERFPRKWLVNIVP